MDTLARPQRILEVCGPQFKNHWSTISRIWECMRMPIYCIRSSCGPILAHPPCFFKNLLQQYPPFTAHFPTKILYLSAISSSFHCTNGTGRCPGGSWPTYFRATVPVDLETWLRRYEDAAKKDIPLRVAFCFDYFVDEKRIKFHLFVKKTSVTVKKFA
jgi:hypothetical protein